MSTRSSRAVRAMAFSFAGSATTNNVPTQIGPDLEEISTEVCFLYAEVSGDSADIYQGLGFQTLAGDAKLRLLPSPWPSNALPAATASLLSVASKKGLLAAAGPESVVVASTEALRQAYDSHSNGRTKSFKPQLTLNLSIRISQVAFSADEECLVLSAENGGGLAVYEVQSLMQGGTQSAFEMSTNNAPLRALLPNPTIEKAELFAVVTQGGELMMANLKSRQFVNGSSGQLLREGVSCVSWSNKGKQLVAGLGNGVCFQMTPEGECKAEISAPSSLEGQHYG